MLPKRAKERQTVNLAMLMILKQKQIKLEVSPKQGNASDFTDNGNDDQLQRYIRDKEHIFSSTCSLG